MGMEEPGTVNRLLPTPAKAKRLRRGENSVKAGMETEGAQWPGHEWVRRSLLKVLGTRLSDEARRLKVSHPCLTALPTAMLKYLSRQLEVLVPTLPTATVMSFSVSPGIRLRKADDDPELHRKVRAQRYAPDRDTPHHPARHAASHTLTDVLPDPAPSSRRQDHPRALLQVARGSQGLCGARTQRPSLRLLLRPAAAVLLL